MAWPKLLVFPDGMKVEVDSWDEIREARAALGGDVQVVSLDGQDHRVTESDGRRFTRPEKDGAIEKT